MSAPPATIARRHDLDALRAIAMLLGIALHGALAYIPMPQGGWPVQDTHQNGSFALFMAAVHGFRMPLFFLISGFFTAMLWRKRGLRSLLQHRFKRIFLPLVIGMFTFVPAVWIVSIGASVIGNQSADIDGNIWGAAKSGNVEKLAEHLAGGAPLNEQDPATGATPISMAAWTGQNEAIELLIAKGADVNARNRDGSTPIHGAAFFGRAETVRILIDHDADPDAKNHKGELAADVIHADWGITLFVAGLVQVDVDQGRLESGREEVSRMLQTAPTHVAGESDTESGLSQDDNEEKKSPSGVLMLLMLFPFYHHLWFLSFLCWLVVAFALYAKLFQRFNWKTPGWFVISPARDLWLIPLTIFPQALMGLLYPNFGPDTSAGLLPMPHVLFYYAIFFFFGAFYFDSDDQTGRVGRWWPVTLPLALLVIFPVGYELTHGGLGFGAKCFADEWHRPLSVVLQVFYVWLMSFGLMGLFRRCLSGESKTMRYISDSSYWLYLAHLPLIIVAQAIVRNWQIPALAKFSLICIVTSALLLASYQLFVRYTPIGTLLNGPRKRPEPIIEAALVESSPAST